jgi:hypothetical protein
LLAQLACVALAWLNLAPGLKAGDVAIVVRPDTPVNNLGFAEARKLFMGDRQFWSSSLRVTLLMRAPVSRDRDVVLNSIYGMNEAQFRQYWISKIFRLEASSGPKIVFSIETAIGLVNAIPGAVAFMDASFVPKNLKILTIDGLAPGDKGYRLH